MVAIRVKPARWNTLCVSARVEEKAKTWETISGFSKCSSTHYPLDTW